MNIHSDIVFNNINKGDILARKQFMHTNNISLAQFILYELYTYKLYINYYPCLFKQNRKIVYDKYR